MGFIKEMRNSYSFKKLVINSDSSSSSYKSYKSYKSYAKIFVGIKAMYLVYYYA